MPDLYDRTYQSGAVRKSVAGFNSIWRRSESAPIVTKNNLKFYISSSSGQNLCFAYLGTGSLPGISR